VEKEEKSIRKITIFSYIKDVSEIINLAIDKNKFIIGYRILNKLSGCIKRQRQEFLGTCNNVVYKVCCNDCEASYVGQTKG